MSRKTLLILGMAHLAWGGGLVAQEEMPPLSFPAEPLQDSGLLADMPASGRWTVKVTQAKKAPENPMGTDGVPLRFVKELRFTKSGTTITLKKLWSDGTNEESWVVKGCLMDIPPNWPFVRMGSMGMMAAIHANGDLPSGKGFSGFEWLNQKTFKDVVSLKDKKCNYYQSDDGIREAWIDVDSKLPVARKTEDALYEYEFFPLGEIPKMPEKFQKALANFEAAQAR
jgi:hypothetical protein